MKLLAELATRRVPTNDTKPPLWFLITVVALAFVLLIGLFLMIS